MKKQITQQEAEVLKYIKKSTSIFPERKVYSKIDDAALGWVHKKRKTNPRLQGTDGLLLNTDYLARSQADTGSKVLSQKKSVRIQLDEPNGKTTGTQNSPVSTGRKKNLMYSPATNNEEMLIADGTTAHQNLASEGTLESDFEIKAKQTTIIQQRSQSLKFPQIQQQRKAPKQNLTLQVNVMNVNNRQRQSTQQQNTSATDLSGIQTESTAIKDARTILELENTFSTTFGKPTLMTTTARQTARSVGLDGRVDRKVLNIMKKLKSRFNPDSHKAKNEKLIQHMRVKAALQKEKELNNQDFVSSDLLMVQDSAILQATENDGNDDKPAHQGQQSSGFIPEVSQESLLTKDDGIVSRNAIDSLPAGKMTESSEFLPQTRVRASGMKLGVDSQQNMMTRNKTGGRKVPNLTAYEPKHLNIQMTPRGSLDKQNRMPLQQPIWERILPAVHQSSRKPVSIEESLTTGYRKRLEDAELANILMENNNQTSSKQLLLAQSNSVPPMDLQLAEQMQMHQMSTGGHGAQLSSGKRKSLEEIMSVYKSATRDGMKAVGSGVRPDFQV